MHNQIRITNVSNIKKDINIINFNKQQFFLTKKANKYFLISRTCPHMGGFIKEEEEKLFCPLHNWWFDLEGKCRNSTQNAFKVELRLEKDYLVANRKELEKFEIKKEKDIQKIEKLSLLELKNIPKVSLHAHATLELKFKDKNVLFDPWLDGPAMLGSWRQYPKALISGRDLNPDVVIITHEHSDHFHIPTLKAIGKDKLIIFPDFKNNRITSFLKKNNFTNFKPLNFDDKYEIFPNSFITFYRPKSLFLDSIVLFEKDSFRFLNLNDAGLNPVIAKKVGPVHLLACIFSTGASGYPLCWNQLDENEKREIMTKACKGRLEMLLQAINMYDANLLLPFASHVRLWLEEHEYYRKNLISNNINDVIDFFKINKKIKYLIPAIPGDTYEISTKKFTATKYDKNKIYDSDYIEKELIKDRKIFNKSLISWGYSNFQFNIDRINNYFLNNLDSSYLNIKEEAYLIINVFGRFKEELEFLFKDGKFYKPSNRKKNIPLIKMKIMDKILMQIIGGRLSWDEAKVGYWIEWWRDTPKVHNLMTRTMQGPNISNLEFASSFSDKDLHYQSIPISEVLRNVSGADDLFKRFGMFCKGCSLSPWESIEDAANAHNLTAYQKIKLNKELKLLLK